MERRSSQFRQEGGWGWGGFAPGAGAYLALGGGHTRNLTLDWRVGAPQVSAQQGLTVHLGLQAGDVAAAEVFAQLVHLLQLQQVNPQHLDGFHHLEREGGGGKEGGREVRLSINTQEMIQHTGKQLHDNIIKGIHDDHPDTAEDLRSGQRSAPWVYIYI